MIGSVWNKWDMHIHCPTSIFNNQFEGTTEEEKWEKYLADLEKHDDVPVIGITDYFSIDGYKKLQGYKAQGRIPNIKMIIPNVELRVLPSTGKNKKINLHILFSPDIVPQLDEYFFPELEFNFRDRPYKLTRNSLIELGRKYKGDIGMDERAAYRTGLEQFCITPDNLKILFNKRKDLRKEAIIGITNNSKDGVSGLQHEDNLKALREDLYHLTDFIFSSRPNDIEYFLGNGPNPKEEIIRKYGSLKPCVHGCDAHTNTKIFNPDEGRFTWIKAEPTFEGFRQILYEPENRVQIKANKPPLPIHRIDKVQLSFPAETKIRDEVFCLSGEREINFSPYYTCIIGGRGVGKSMLLNLIHEHLDPGKNNEIKKIKQQGLYGENDERLVVKDLVKIDGDTDEKYIEFFSQNEIEEFALDYGKLTHAIYSRLLKRDRDGDLKKFEKNLEDKLQLHDEYINALVEHNQLQKEKKRLEREKESLINIISTFSSEEYQNIDSNIKLSRSRLEDFGNAEKEFNDLRTELQDIISKYADDITNTPNIVHYTKTNEALSLIQQAVAVLDTLDPSSAAAQKSELEQAYKIAKEDLTRFLEQQDLPEESINEVAVANEKLSINQSHLREVGQKITSLGKFIEDYSVGALEDVHQDFSTRLRTFISETSEKLEELESEFVKPITLNLDFSFENAQNRIFDRFEKVFGTQIDEAELRGKHYLKEILFTKKISDIWEARDKQQIIEGINSNPSASKAKPFLQDLFSKEQNLDFFFEIIRRECMNLPEFKQITVRYDHKRLEDSSFGQRCTAALVTLIVLGNTPIIIDEPEAHLDSLLISNFLVEVIKKQKQHRQIIFATHNANFVINADADLIHILSMDENNITHIQSTTIEKLETREKLISLEGGAKAFKNRENRYAIE